MLIKPVQRITKYPLLFEDLLASTTPVHPDYFSIRTAAEMARSVAMEIDEAKRRKDAVARAIAPKRPLAAPIPNNQRPSSSKGRTLNLFKKDKVNGTASDAMSKTSSDVGLPSVITPASFALLKDLIKRIEEGEQVVRQVGKEVILWTAAAKELCVVEDKLIGTWLRVYQLDFPDVHDWKLSAFRIVLEDIYSDAWAALVSTSVLCPRCMLIALSE